MNRGLLTEEWLSENGYTFDNRGDILPTWFSEDRRIIIIKYSNMPGRDWFVRIDNEDHQTIGGLSVQYIYQLEGLLELLKE